MKPIRKTRHALMFMGAGAVAAYFLDPESGPDRRERIMQQIRSITEGTTGSPGGGSQGSDEAGGTSGSDQSRSAAADAFSTRGRTTDDEVGQRSGPIDLATGEPVLDQPGADRTSS